MLKTDVHKMGKCVASDCADIWSLLNHSAHEDGLVIVVSLEDSPCCQNMSCSILSFNQKLKYERQALFLKNILKNPESET